MTSAERLRREAIERQTAAFRRRKPRTQAEIASLEEKIAAQKSNPQPMSVTQVDPPVESDFYKGRWVVHVVESNGLFVRPMDKVFDTEAEAHTYYQEVKAA